MGNLPVSRTITISNGDPIPPGLLNELQDQDIIHNGAVTTWFPIMVPGTGTVAPTAVLTMDGTHTLAWVPIALPIGRKIVATKAVIRDNATGPTKQQCGIRKADATSFAAGGGSSSSGFGSASLGNGTVQTIQSAVLSVPVVAGEQYAVAVEFNTGTASSTVGFVGVDHIAA